MGLKGGRTQGYTNGCIGACTWGFEGIQYKEGSNILVASQSISEVSCFTAPPAPVPLLPIQLLLTPLQLLRDVVPHFLQALRVQVRQR